MTDSYQRAIFIVHSWDLFKLEQKKIWWLVEEKMKTTLSCRDAYHIKSIGSYCYHKADTSIVLKWPINDTFNNTFCDDINLALFTCLICLSPTLRFKVQFVKVALRWCVWWDIFDAVLSGRKPIFSAILDVQIFFVNMIQLDFLCHITPHIVRLIE